MESYNYNTPPSIPCRDVTLLYSSKDQSWCDFIVKRFRLNQLHLQFELLAVDDTDYENPPEIEMAVRASRVLVLFTTTNLLTYMEIKKDWFPHMLRKSDPEVSVIFNVMLGLEAEDITTFLEDNPYTPKESKRMELLEDASNLTEVIASIINLVEIYTERKVKRDAPPKRRPSEDSTKSVQIVPRSIRKVGEKMALLFRQEVTGEVTVNFNHQKDNVSCELVNPYCALFTVPEISRNESRIAIQIDVDGVRHSRHRLSNDQATSQFSSIDLLCQAHGTSSTEELDKMLANKFSHSLCSDPLAIRIFDTDTNYPSERTSQQYPTMLHWAAAHGLKELTSAFLSAPGAIQASQINNVDNHDPIDLAKKNGHRQLSKFIYEFLMTSEKIRKEAQEAQELANACDLYVQCAIQEGGESEYEEMNAPGVFNYSSPTVQPGATGTPEKSDTTKEPPPVPPRTSRKNSAVSTDEIPTPKDFFFVGPRVLLPFGAVGSRSQTELIEIQEEVKRGNFSIQEAEMLFRSWKERYTTGNAVSFRERQQGLKAFREEHVRAVEMHRKVNKGNKMQKKPESEECTKAVDISDPILKRHNNLPGKRQMGADRGDSLNSNVSCQSHDSGRDSCQSVISQGSISPDDAEYHNPDDEFGPEHLQMRSPNQTERRESTKANRQSMKDMYLSLVEESEHEGMEPPQTPPPIPPRPMPRAPPPLSAKAKPRSLSQSALTTPSPKTQVFVRQGSLNSSSGPAVAPRSNKK